MTKPIEAITAALLEMQHDLIQISDSPSDELLRQWMGKYDIRLVGENFNRIYAKELRHSLAEKFNVQISERDLIELIPSICSGINMETQLLITLWNAAESEQPCNDYLICLLK